VKKIILVGRSEAGKTTLTQAMRGEQIRYQKTQYTNYHDVIIDTPGEYAETKVLAGALALYSYEADVVGLLLSAREEYSLYSPNITCLVNREVIGIVTQIDHKDAHPKRASEWLKLAGCERIFLVSAYKGEGISELLEYLDK
jgi:ethanolamine utilization protein EutP